jgi:hypothetical protein
MRALTLYFDGPSGESTESKLILAMAYISDCVSLRVSPCRRG